MKKPMSLILQSCKAIVAGHKVFKPIKGTGCARHPKAYYRASLYTPGCLNCHDAAMAKYRKKNPHQDPTAKQGTMPLRHQANIAMVKGHRFFMPHQYTQCEQHPKAAFIATATRADCFECYKESQSRKGSKIRLSHQQAYDAFVKVNKPIPVLKPVKADVKLPRVVKTPVPYKVVVGRHGLENHTLQ